MFAGNHGVLYASFPACFFMYYHCIPRVTLLLVLYLYTYIKISFSLRFLLGSLRFTQSFEWFSCLDDSSCLCSIPPNYLVYAYCYGCNKILADWSKSYNKKKKKTSITYCQWHCRFYVHRSNNTLVLRAMATHAHASVASHVLPWPVDIESTSELLHREALLLVYVNINAMVLQTALLKGRWCSASTLPKSNYIHSAGSFPSSTTMMIQQQQLNANQLNDSNSFYSTEINKQTNKQTNAGSKRLWHVHTMRYHLAVIKINESSACGEAELNISLWRYNLGSCRAISVIFTKKNSQKNNNHMEIGWYFQTRCTCVQFRKVQVPRWWVRSSWIGSDLDMG